MFDGGLLTVLGKDMKQKPTRRSIAILQVLVNHLKGKKWVGLTYFQIAEEARQYVPSNLTVKRRSTVDNLNRMEAQGLILIKRHPGRGHCNEYATGPNFRPDELCSNVNDMVRPGRHRPRTDREKAERAERRLKRKMEQALRYQAACIASEYTPICEDPDYDEQFFNERCETEYARLKDAEVYLRTEKGFSQRKTPSSLPTASGERALESADALSFFVGLYVELSEYVQERVARRKKCSYRKIKYRRYYKRGTPVAVVNWDYTPPKHKPRYPVHEFGMNFQHNYRELIAHTRVYREIVAHLNNGKPLDMRTCRALEYRIARDQILPGDAMFVSKWFKPIVSERYNAETFDYYDFEILPKWKDVKEFLRKFWVYYSRAKEICYEQAEPKLVPEYQIGWELSARWGGYFQETASNVPLMLDALYEEGFPLEEFPKPYELEFSAGTYTILEDQFICAMCIAWKYNDFRLLRNLPWTVRDRVRYDDELVHVTLPRMFAREFMFTPERQPYVSGEGGRARAYAFMRKLTESYIIPADADEPLIAADHFKRIAKRKARALRRAELAHRINPISFDWYRRMGYEKEHNQLLEAC